VVTRLEEIRLGERIDKVMEGKIPPDQIGKSVDITKAYKQKALEDITYTDKDAAGNEIKKPILNPVARAFEIQAREAEQTGDVATARFWREFNEKMASEMPPWTTQYGTEVPGWYDVVLRDPTKMFGADASLNSVVVMTPTEAEVVQRYYSGTLLENNNSTNPLVHEIARLVKNEKDNLPEGGKLYTSLVPNEILPEKSVNIRNIARSVIAEESGLGRYLREAAKSDLEVAAVGDFLKTGNTSYLLIYEEGAPPNTRLFDAMVDFEILTSQAPTTDVMTSAMIRYGDEVAARYGIQQDAMEDVFRRVRGTRAGEVFEAERRRREGPEEMSIEELLGEETPFDAAGEPFTIIDPTEVRNKKFTILDLVAGGIGKPREGAVPSELELLDVNLDFQRLSEGSKNSAITKMTDYLSDILTPMVKEVRGKEWFLFEKKPATAAEQVSQEIGKWREIISGLSQEKKTLGLGQRAKRARIDKALKSARQELARAEGRGTRGEPFKEFKNVLEAVAPNQNLPIPPEPSTEVLRRLKEKGVILKPEFEERIQEERP